MSALNAKDLRSKMLAAAELLRDVPGASHLIAAAPDLLEACRTALAIADGMQDFHDGAEGTDARRQLEDAIAKAEGRE